MNYRGYEIKRDENLCYRVDFGLLGKETFCSLKTAKKQVDWHIYEYNKFIEFKKKEHEEWVKNLKANK